MECRCAISSAVGFLGTGGGRLAGADFCERFFRPPGLEDAFRFTAGVLDATGRLAAGFFLTDRGWLEPGRDFFPLVFFIPLCRPLRLEARPCGCPAAFRD